jgi:hypothetical protein
VARSIATVTRLPSKDVAVFGAILTEKIKRLRYNPEDIAKIGKSEIGKVLREAFDGKYAKFFSSAPIRKAAVLSAIRQNDVTYAKKIYDMLMQYSSSGRFPRGTPPVVKAMVKQLYLGKLKGRHSISSGQLRKEIFCIAMYMFTPKNARKQSFGGALKNYPKYRDQAISLVESALGA